MDKAMLRNQVNVLVAIMLRNIRTRFFGTGLGYVISIGWPLAHVAIILLLNAFVDRSAPYGDSLVMFYVSGLIPFMVFNYMARFIMYAVVQSRALLAFPAVKITDLLFGAGLLEVVASSWSAAILALVLITFGFDVVPGNIPQAVAALASTFLLGFGYGILGGLIGLAFPAWVTGSVLMTIMLYLLSGIFFVVDTLPESARFWLGFNPLLHDVLWMRSAYYEGYGQDLNRSYAVACGVALLFLGLAIERLIRGRFLMLR